MIKTKKVINIICLTSFWIVLHVLSQEQQCSSNCDGLLSCVSNYSTIFYVFSTEKNNLCDSRNLCFGENSLATVPLQQRPLNILKNQSLTFSLGTYLSKAYQLYIFNDTFYSKWAQCDVENIFGIQLESNEDGNLHISSIKLGKHYFLFNTSKQMCLNGLRIQVNVFDHSCINTNTMLNTSNTELCSSNGKCLYNESANMYKCKCCLGFVGQYCEKRLDGQSNLILLNCQKDALDLLQINGGLTCGKSFIKVDNLF